MSRHLRRLPRTNTPPAVLELRAAWGVPKDAYVIGSVGRLVRIKGVDYAIRAMPDILRANAKAHLVIIGSGREEAALKQLAAELGVTRHVTFAGFRRDIADCMRAFDCFVSASLSEGLGLNVLEAMASGLPAIVTGVGGILDFTEHEVNGLIIEPCSSEQLAEAVIRLMEEPETAARLAERRGSASSVNSLERMGQRTAAIYRKLLRIAGEIRDAAGKPDAKKLVISGYYGYGNSGDEADLSSILQALRNEAEKQQVNIVPTVLSVNPRATEQMHGVRAISRMNLLGIVRELRRSDGLVSGGGSLLQEITGRMTIRTISASSSLHSGSASRRSSTRRASDRFRRSPSIRSFDISTAGASISLFVTRSRGNCCGRSASIRSASTL